MPLYQFLIFIALSALLRGTLSTCFIWDHSKHYGAVSKIKTCSEQTQSNDCYDLRPLLTGLELAVLCPPASHPQTLTPVHILLWGHALPKPKACAPPATCPAWCSLGVPDLVTLGWVGSLPLVKAEGSTGSQTQEKVALMLLDPWASGVSATSSLELAFVLTGSCFKCSYKSNVWHGSKTWPS